MNLVNIALIIAMIVIVVVIVALVARRARESKTKHLNAPASVNLSNINIQQSGEAGGMSASQHNIQATSSVDSLKDELVSRIEGLMMLVSEINKKINELASELAVQRTAQQESPVVMVGYAPLSLGEVRSMVNVTALALVDASNLKVVESDGDYDFDRFTSYIQVMMRDGLRLLSFIRGNDNVVMVPTNRDNLYVIAVANRPLTNVEVNVILSLINNYVSSK